MRISFNAPFTLFFTFCALAANILNVATNQQTQLHFFCVYSPLSFQDPFSIVRLFLHPLGHANWGHFTSNFSIILLIGPLVEGYYGSFRLFVMTLITTIATGLIHVIFFKSALMGASGIAFMMILLGSFANSKRGSIPLTFLLVALIYVGNEVMSVFNHDNISQLAHIIGACFGALFGFMGQYGKKPGKKKTVISKEII